MKLLGGRSGGKTGRSWIAPLGDGAGFTLPEVIVAVVLFGMIATMLVGVLTLGVGGAGSAGHRSVALALVRSQLESIKEADYAEPISYATVATPDADFEISIGGSVLEAGFLEQIDMTVLFPGGEISMSAYKVNHLPPIHADAPIAISPPDCPAAKSCLLFYLHNSPSPPVGDTNAQANLPMDETSSPAFLRFSYDADITPDNGFGISINEKGTVSSTDLKLYRNWGTAPLVSSMHIDGEIEVHLWSGTKFFQLNKVGEVTIFLRSWDGSSYTSIASQTLLVNDWMSGFEDYVPARFIISGIDHTIGIGDQLDLRVVVGKNSQTREMWFMYDFIDFDSKVFVQTTP